MNATYQDQSALKAATDACLANDVRVLQLYRCGDERDHVARLLEMMAPSEHACIIDVGCGVGTVALHMSDLRPDLGFLLLNLSPYQLDLCPAWMTRVQADMHDMPVNDVCADVVMVNYTFGYADPWVFLKEAHRVLKPGGVLFIYDLSRRELVSMQPCALMREKFDYKVYSRHFVNSTACAAGFRFDRIHFPEATHDHLVPILDAEYRDVMNKLNAEAQPTAWRFIKETA